jgi:hypothetical protein
MKKQISKLTAVFLVLVIILFSACSKTDNPKTNQQYLDKNLVPIELAKEVAQKFNANTYLHKLTNMAARVLTGNNAIISQYTINDKNGHPATYIFNFDNNAGFVIVSADYGLRPILAYVESGNYNGTNMPDGFQDWLNRTKENTEVLRDELYDNTINGARAWRKYFAEYGVDTTIIAGKPMPIDPDPNPCGNPPPPNSIVVGPLLPVTWGQSCTYNDLCALNQNFNCNTCGTGRPLTGCVATSMAQVMRYHQFPNGYNYATMPAASGDFAVQSLMRDAGNSVNMMYGCNGSGAYVSDVVPALKNTFGYSSANIWSYSQSSYNQGYGRVKDNIIQNHWPVILAGSDEAAGGHQWVCDGTLETTYYFGDCGTGNSSATYLNFHMNWGWHEDWMNGNSNATDYNGWFAFDNWTIYGLNWNFQYNRYAITEIHP